MKTPVFARFVVSLMIGAGVLFAANEAMGDVMWTYDSAKKTITSIPPEGADESFVSTVYGLSAAGVITANKNGSDKVIDFRAEALPSDAPAITKIGDIRNHTTVEEVYLPSTLGELNGCAFYGWSKLKYVEFPETVPSTFKMGGLAFSGSVITSVILPEGMTTLGNDFSGCTSLEYVKLPSTLKSLGSNAFNGDKALKLIEPCVPKGVTSFAERALQQCAITNGLEIGYAEDENGAPILMQLSGGLELWGTVNIPYVKFGPSVTSINANFFFGGGFTALGYLEFGENLKTLELNTIGAANLTNIVFKTTDTMTLNAATFQGCKAVKEVTWNGWFEYSTGKNAFGQWTDLQCRFIYPGDNLKWAAYVGDATKVTPWASCEQADKDKYKEVYGNDAAEPVGISVAVSSGLPRTYLVSDGKTISGVVVSVDAPATAFGTVTMDPEPSASGTYELNKDVTITFTPAEGVTFRGWAGSVEGVADTNALTITVKATGAASLTPNFDADFLYYDEEAGTLTDGKWTVSVTGAAEALKVTGIVTAGPDGHLNLGKRVKDGKIVTIGEKAFDVSFTESKEPSKMLTLPETLESLESRAIGSCPLTTITPFFPRSVTNAAGCACFGNTSLSGDFEIGFATNAEGKVLETKLGDGVLQDSYLVGPTIKLGPGVKAIPLNMFWNVGKNREEPMEVWIGENVESAAEKAFGYVGYLRQVTYHFEGDMFDGSSKMFYDGSTFAGGAYMHRYFIGADGCPKWREYLDNKDCVKPWAELDEEIKKKYWTNFPEETFGKVKPYGLTTANSIIETTQGLPPNQWVFSLRTSGMVIRVQ